MPGTPIFWAELGGWRASRVERVRLLRDLIVFYHSVPSHGTIAGIQAMDSACALFDAVTARLAAASKDRVVFIKSAAGRSRPREVRELLEVLGYEIKEQNKKLSIRPRHGPDHEARRTLLSGMGVNLATFVDRLQHGEPATLTWPTFTIPLPLGKDFWVNEMTSQRVSDARLAIDIVSTRRWGLLYVGLTALDPDTLATFALQPKFVARLADDNAAVFAMFSRSLRIVGGRIVTPGGPSVVALWEELAGAHVDEPLAFIKRLVGADNGCAAWFFDFVQHSPPNVQAFALSSWETDASERRRRVGAFYGAFWSAADVERVDFRERRFGRPVLDPGLIASLLAIGPDGRVLGPSSKAFWRDVFGSFELPVVITRSPRAVSSEDVFDAAAVIGGVRDMMGDERGWTASFKLAVSVVVMAQSFAIADPQASASDIATIARASARFPALVRSLERLRVGTATAIALIDQARVLSALDGKDHQAAMGQFQAAIALIEQAALSNGIDAAQTEALLTSLASVRLADERRYRGGLVRWLSTTLAPVAHARADLSGATTPETMEQKVIALTTGRVRGRSAPTFDWEGFPYRADPASVRFRHAERIRARRAGITLDFVVDMLEAAESVATVDGPDPAKRAAARLREIETRVARLRPEIVSGDRVDAARMLGDAARTLDGIRTAREASRRVEARAAVLDAIDWIGFAVLRSLAYVGYLGDPDNPLLPGEEILSRHDFGSGEGNPRLREWRAWSLPAQRVGQGVPWHIRGSMLALDFALGSLMWRDFVEGPPNATDMDEADHEGLVRTALAMHAHRLWTPDDARAVSERAASTRRAIAAGARPPVDRWEWRFAAYDWAAAHESDAADSLFDVAELLEPMSSSSSSADLQLDAFGPQLTPLTGSLRNGAPPRLLRECVAGQVGLGYVSASTMDLKVRLAELMNELRLPVVLAPRLMVRATMEVMTGMSMGAPFDCTLVRRRMRDFSSKSLAELVMALTTDGSVVPADP